MFLGQTMTARISLLSDFAGNRTDSPRRKLRSAPGVRDILADWNRWTLAERVIAVAILGVFVLTASIGPALISITPALIGR